MDAASLYDSFNNLVKFLLESSLGKTQLPPINLYARNIEDRGERARKANRKGKKRGLSRSSGTKSRNFGVYTRCGTSDNRIVVEGEEDSSPLAEINREERNAEESIGAEELVNNDVYRFLFPLGLCQQPPRSRQVSLCPGLPLENRTVCDSFPILPTPRQKGGGSGSRGTVERGERERRGEACISFPLEALNLLLLLLSSVQNGMTSPTTFKSSTFYGHRCLGSVSCHLLEHLRSLSDHKEAPQYLAINSPDA